MVRRPQGETQASKGAHRHFRFTQSEVEQMEKILEKNNGSSPGRDVVQSLAEKFNTALERAEDRVEAKQVNRWFQKRRLANKAKAGMVPAASDTGAAANSDEVPLGEQASDILGLEFEAKSKKDGAWYDVETFLTHRILESGEPEVRVRFAGFNAEEDEWVNVRKAVRQRSLPCEPSECTSINPGDTILCFQECSLQAIYFDARVMEIQRKRHDVRGCRCRFLVRYEHDQREERVALRRIYRRPEV